MRHFESVSDIAATVLAPVVWTVSAIVGFAVAGITALTRGTPAASR